MIDMDFKGLEEKFIGTLLGTAIGDTLGVPFEEQIREQIIRYFEDFYR